MNDAIAGHEAVADRFVVLHEMYDRRVSAYVAAILSRTYRRTDYHLVQDLTQDTWVAAWKGLHTLRASDDRAFGWLATIARREVGAYFRRARATREAAVDFSTEAGERRLPMSPAAEDEAIAVMRLVRMLEEPSGTPLGVAA